MNCELHTNIFHPLEMVNLHLARRDPQPNSYFGVLWPMETFAFGPTRRAPDRERQPRGLPDCPGLGAALDWGLIDASTIAELLRWTHAFCCLRPMTTSSFCAVALRSGRDDRARRGQRDGRDPSSALGHKIAARAIPEGGRIVKYGAPHRHGDRGLLLPAPM